MEIIRFRKTVFKNIGWLLIAWIGSLLLVGPIIMVLMESGGLSKSGITHLASTVLSSYVLNTLWLASGITLISFVIGVGLAWVVTMYDFPLRKKLEWLLILPLAIPTFINGIAYVGLTDYAGPIRIWLRNSGYINDIYFDIMNGWGAMFVMSTVLYPYVYLTTRAAFASQSVRLLEASKMMGISESKSFFKIALPLAWPAIFSGLSLVLMEILNDYGTVKYFGIPTFTTGIFKFWLSLGDISTAVFLALVLLLFVVAIITVERWLTRNKRIDQTKTSQPITRRRLFGWQKTFALTITLLPFIAGFLIPVFQMLWWLNLSFERTNWAKLIISFWNTITLSFYTSVLIIGLGILMAYSFRIFRNQRFAQPLARISALGYAMPGAVVAIGIIASILLIDSRLIYAGIYAILFGYVVRFFAVGFNPIESGFKQNATSLDDAAESMGSSKIKTLLRVHIPLIKRAVLVSLILIFVDVAKELPITLILRPFNFTTLATNAYQFATDEMAPESSAASLLIVAIGILPIYLLNKSMSAQK